MSILIIVESPAKCKKIEGYLGKGYKCIASFGHIYELDSISEADNYEPKFVLLKSKSKNIKFLRDNIKKANEIIIATDDDREGEAIAWHICRLGKLPIITTKRIIFHEITKKAILYAVNNPTVIDMDKVNAQLGRQILDRMVGYTISPILWEKFFYGGKNKSGLSAGRCQTPALRLVYDNQKDIDASPGKRGYDTRGNFTEMDLEYRLNHSFGEKESVESFLTESMNFQHIIQPGKDTLSKRKPPLPFSTSSLQQRASSELNYTPKQTMVLAQKLYEGGYITYMRTDNNKYSSDFIDQSIIFIKDKWTVDDSYIRDDIDTIAISSKGDKQGAHEAIRPTEPKITTTTLGINENRLYLLIWTNSLESCMSDAIFNVVTSTITAPCGYIYKHVEDLTEFPGWMVIKGFLEANEKYNYIKSLQKDKIGYKNIYSKESLTELKSHYTESRLVHMLENNGIGRPSTFSSITSKIQDKGYVTKCNIEGVANKCTDYKLVGDELTKINLDRIFGSEKNKLYIQPLGRMVIEFLIDTFDTIFEYNYTEAMEDELDKISNGISRWQDLCRVCDINMKKIIGSLPIIKKEIVIDANNTYMVGRYGPVVKCNNDGVITFKKAKSDLDMDRLSSGGYDLQDIIVINLSSDERRLGEYNGKEMVLKSGKFGLYVSYNSKRFSVKNLNKSMSEIKREDIIDIITGKKNENPNIIKILNDNLSIRKGKYGEYVFYKKPNMNKPRFFQLMKIFQNEKDKKWKNYSNGQLIDLINNLI
jgi:DNA topoisomerase I